MVQYPKSFIQLRTIFRKLAYQPAASDPWQRLGFAALDGPDPTATSIAARAHTFKMLSGLADKAGWNLDDRAAAHKAMERMGEAIYNIEAKLDNAGGSNGEELVLLRR